MTQEKFELEVQSLKTNETWIIMKNIVIIGLSFMLLYTAYSGAVNLQSSINADSGLGTSALAAVYASLVVSNIFLPAAVIKWLGTKWVMCLAILMYIPYIIAQMHPTFYTLIPAGVLVGLGCGPLWCAKCTYLSMSADAHSKISKILPKDLLVRFLGLFFMIIQTAQIWGNLISSLVLSSGDNEAAITNVNETMIPLLCGANFLATSTDFEPMSAQPPEKIQMMSGIYLTSIVGAAVLIALGVDSLNSHSSSPKGSTSGPSGLALLVVTMKHCAQPTQLLLITINIFIGLHQSFFSADFSASFVSCAVGTGSVGFVMMTFGVSDAVGCLVTGYLAQLYGRLPLIICTVFIHGGLFATMLVWRPHAGDIYIMFTIAMLWGLCDSVWNVQMTGFYGTLFTGKEEAAFSSYRLFEAIGYILTFAISPYLRTRYKIYLLLSTMTLGVSGYFTVEYQQYRKSKQIEGEKCEEKQMMKVEQQYDYKQVKKSLIIKQQIAASTSHFKKSLKLDVDGTWRILKNVAVVSVAFMICFTAYYGLINLQSSINADEGLGTASLASTFAGFLLSNLFLPAAIIKCFGTKWTVCFSLLTFIPYIGFQMYPRFYTLIPAGIIMGLGAGPLWCAKCTYLALAAEAHSTLSKIPAGILLQRFLGFFYMIYQTSQIWGNLIASLVLSSGHNTAAVTSVNETMIPQICGANFLPNSYAQDALPTQPSEKIRLIAEIYLACIVGSALIVAVGLDPMTKYESSRKSSSALSLLAVTVKQLSNLNQLLILPINVFLGFYQAFFDAVYTASFISCPVGTGSVGYIMISYGVSDAIGCFVTGILAKMFGRIPLFLGALLVHGGVFVTLLTWRPHAGDYYVMFIIAVLWGLCDSVWLVQINAYYGVLFRGHEEAAFSNFRLWEATGFIIGFVLAPSVRTRYIIYILFCNVIVGVCCYLAVEYRQARQSNRPNVSQTGIPEKSDIGGEGFQSGSQTP